MNAVTRSIDAACGSCRNSILYLLSSTARVSARLMGKTTIQGESCHEMYRMRT